MTGRPWIGLALALVVEARYSTRVRWDFDDDACGRVWRFTLLAIILAAGSIWLDGKRVTALQVLLSWMPPLLLPLQFVQSYGMRDSLPLTTFSFLARQRRLRNERLGLIEETVDFNFGNVLFAVAMVGAAVGSRAGSWMFLPGLVILVGWLLLGRGGVRAGSLFPMLAAAGLFALAGQAGLERAVRWISNGGEGSGGGREGFDPNFSSTLIGSRGRIRQSPDIVWRVHPEMGSAAPSLLRTGTFNLFFRTHWHNQRDDEADFSELETRVIGAEPIHLLTDSGKAESLTGLPSFKLRGAVLPDEPLPLPGDAAALRDFEIEELERNSFGCVRVTPKHAVMDGSVFWKGGTNPEKPPIPREDLRLSPGEEDLIRGVVDALDLRTDADLRTKLAFLQSWFGRNFRYTRELTIRQPPAGPRNDRTGPTSALGVFLGEVREGHCEYFATAATLMLREMGIPARYATGYAVIERDVEPGGFVIRGTHGHAWCRVWDEASGTWLDFDPTPPDWLAALPPGQSRSQRFADSLKRFREDFFIWRNHPTHQLAMSLVMAGVGLGLGGFVARRLWRSRRHVASPAETDFFAGPSIRTPLHALEALARRQLGPRPPGAPLAGWLLRLRPSLAETAALDEAIALHQRLRFDPAAAPQGQRERLAELVRELEPALRRRAGRWDS